VTGWRVNPVEIDNVPIVMLTLSSQSGQHDSMTLRHVADELIVAFKSIDDIGKSWVVGGEQRRVSIYVDPVRFSIQSSRGWLGTSSSASSLQHYFPCW